MLNLFSKLNTRINSTSTFLRREGRVKLLLVREGVEGELYPDLKNFLYSLNNRQVLVLLYTGEL